MDVKDAIEKRISVRSFRPDPVPLAVVKEILDRARPGGRPEATCSPGGCTPWRATSWLA